MRTSLVAVALAMVVLLTILIAVSMAPTNIPYDVNNPNWDGYSRASALCGFKQLYGLSNVNNASLLILIPQTPPSARLINELRGFLTNGGWLVVLSNGLMYGNAVLSGLHVNVTIGGGVITDPLFNLGNPYVIIGTVVNTTIVNESLTVVLDNASPIVVSGGATVMAYSSQSSLVSSTVGPYPVMVYVKYGRGYLIVASTPSVFMNSLIGEFNNSQLLKALCVNRTVGFLEPLLANNPQLRLRGFFIEAYAYLSLRPVNYIMVMAPLIIASLALAKHKNT
ncbi:DUF4350 domain-containing protein [Caldivirga maquilingensis]|uniref:DUF4350 domain-containing protein n=1 Tax=Caldivirga maquilingensis (strain ATCC 700844 / DSM 13496 / JCM 10307 / IC-167) TaxID=397948 RepID=A8M935_CALMQ|nr:DUF4350 domain-containing protein [Caldivirga maquilingensis]ABW02254.1 hypothetical protein Cmaq_1429 [Caldivirga maquilingensis IC-167]